MKAFFKKSLFAMMVMFVLASAVSCQKDDAKDEPEVPQTLPSIVGLWKAVEVGGKSYESVFTESYFMEFAPNGWFYESGEENGTRYKIDGIYFKVISDEGKIYSRIFELSSDEQYLTIYNEDAIESIRVENSIKFKRIGTSEKTAQSAKELLRGTWNCKKNAYGNPWDGTKEVVCKVIFSKRMISMDWYCGSELLDSGIYENFEIVDNKLVINGYSSPLEYKLTNDNNTLTIYGLDKDDMAELTFERAK